MSKAIVRLAFVGLGGMGQVAHLRNYVITPGTEVAAAAEIRPLLARKVCDRYGIRACYQDFRELLAREEADGIVAIQQYATHGQIVPELLKKGVPVLIEKPLALSVEVGEKIAAAANASGSPLYVAYHKRSDPAVMHAREVMAGWKHSGEFGSLKYIRLTMPPGPWPSPRSGYDTLLETDEPWPAPVRDEHCSTLNDKNVQRLDSFINFYIHQVNLLRHLLEEDYEVNYADPAGVVMGVRSRSGIPGILEMNPFRSDVEWQEQALVCFEKAWIRIDIPGPLAVDTAGRVTIFRDRCDGSVPEAVSPSLPPIHAMRQQACHFVDAIRGEKTPLCMAEEALKDLRTARAYMNLLIEAEERIGEHAR